MRIIKITLLLLISFNVSFKVISANDLQNIFSDDGKIIFIRHAYAPGGGDPDGFDISNCASQRNLNSEGIAQSKRIGKFFKENNIKLIKFYLVNGVDVKKQQNMLLIIMKLKVS